MDLLKRKKLIYIAPPSDYPHQLDRMFPQLYQPLAKELAKSGCRLKFCPLAKIPKRADLVILDGIAPNQQLNRLLTRFPKEKIIGLVLEPPTVIPYPYLAEAKDHFCKLHTWNDDLVDHQFYYPLNYILNTIPIANPYLFERRQFLTQICRNKASSYLSELYSERRRAIEFYERNHPKDFQFYGKRWKNHGFTTYKGEVKDKITTLQRYLFSICYENTKDIAGYVTEKIMDCFIAGCVPVYWGASNIETYVPKECFIDRREFQSYEELHEFLKQMSKTDYNRYLDAITQYLKSDQVKCFSFAARQKILLASILETLFPNAKSEDL